MQSTNLFIGHQLNHREALSRLGYWLDLAQKSENLENVRYYLRIVWQLNKILKERDYYHES